MVGKSIYELSFAWKRQDITLAPKTSVIINNEPVQVDPQLMFQRLRAIATRETNDTRYKIQDTRILFRYHRLTIEYNKIYIYTMSVKNKDQTKSKYLLLQYILSND